MEGVRCIGVCYKGKYQEDANFETRLSVRLIEGVRLIGGLLYRRFTVLVQIRVISQTSTLIC